VTMRRWFFAKPNLQVPCMKLGDAFNSLGSNTNGPSAMLYLKSANPSQSAEE